MILPTHSVEKKIVRLTVACFLFVLFGLDRDVFESSVLVTLILTGLSSLGFEIFLIP